MKAEKLTRDILLEYAKRQGAVIEVLSVTVQNMQGTKTMVKLDKSQNTVRWLKQTIQDKQGISTLTQQLILMTEGGDNAAGASGGAGAMQEPLKDDDLVSDLSIVLLCVDYIN